MVGFNTVVGYADHVQLCCCHFSFPDDIFAPCFLLSSEFLWQLIVGLFFLCRLEASQATVHTSSCIIFTASLEQK